MAMIPATEGNEDLTDKDAQVAKIAQARIHALNTPTEGPTLLWSRPARWVSSLTGLASFSVRAGAKVGGWGVTAARESTLKYLELNRAFLETVLWAAGKEISSRRTSELAKEDAENIVEKAIGALHTAISSASFFAASGFYITQASIDQASAVTVQSLAILNAIFGCTESSRAVSAIITLIKTELNKPGQDGSSEAISTADLFVGVAGFLYLQRISKRKTEIEFRDAGGEETIWDVVIDDKGFRADVVGTRRKNEAVTGIHTVAPSRRDDGEEVAVIEREFDDLLPALSLTGEEQANLTDEEIRERIMAQLPQGAKATISSETLTLKTIRVDIHDAETANIEAPPGLTMVSEHLAHDTDGSSEDSPHQTIIFRTASKRASSAQVQGLDNPRITNYDERHEPNEGDEIVMMRLAPTGIRRSLNYDRQSLTLPIESEYSHRPQNFADPTGPIANQKKSRKPASAEASSANSPKSSRLPLPKMKSENKGEKEKEKTEKGGALKKALKSLSPSQSSTMINRTTTRNPSRWLGDTAEASKSIDTSLRPLTHQNAPKRVYPTLSGVDQPPTYSDTTRTTPTEKDGMNNSYFTVHEKKRESTYSQTDTYSVHSTDSRPSSPSHMRTHLRTTSALSKTKSHTEISLQDNNQTESGQDSLHHRRSRSFVPSLYSMATKNSDEAIILAPKTPIPRISIFEDEAMIVALATDGKVPGIFPNRHLVSTVRRFSRFASASYGSNFLRFMGLAGTSQNLSKTKEMTTVDVHHEHSSFSSYTGLPAHTIVLSSFLDPGGMTTVTSASAEILSPLIHFISIDSESKAVVLTCRGTLGFEDLLTDMTCDYDDIHWQGQVYQVHKGIHTSARRLLEGRGGNRVMATIKASLEQFPDFGLVLCGHSLGGAVAAVTAILISEPQQPVSDSPGHHSSFVTANRPKLLTSAAESKAAFAPITLPSGRPIHVYAYGPPATFSPPLRLATRGLITTLINANDIVPSLSLGTLHDFRAVARHLKSDIVGSTLEQLRTRVWDRVWNGISSTVWPGSGGQDGRAAGFPPPPGNVAGDGVGEDNWAWDELCRMREMMTSEKLVPPGECWVLDSTRVWDRRMDDGDGTGPGKARGDYEMRSLGRPATRVQFKLIRDVETRFKELRFGRQMFQDHSPGRYESALAALEKGVCEE